MRPMIAKVGRLNSMHLRVLLGLTINISLSLALARHALLAYVYLMRIFFVLQTLIPFTMIINGIYPIYGQFPNLKHKKASCLNPASNLMA